MKFELVTGVGLLASTLSAFSLLPQLAKLIKERKAEGISITMLCVLFAGLSSWIYYGFLKEDWIIIISNAVSLLLNSTIVGFTLKYKR